MLKAKIEASAADAGRSLNAEIVRQLEAAYDPDEIVGRLDVARNALRLRDLELSQRMLTSEVGTLGLWIRILLDRLGEPKTERERKEADWLRAKADLLVNGLRSPLDDMDEVRLRIDAAVEALRQAHEAADKIFAGGEINYEGDLDASRWVVRLAQRSQEFLEHPESFHGDIRPAPSS